MSRHRICKGISPVDGVGDGAAGEELREEVGSVPQEADGDRLPLLRHLLDAGEGGIEVLEGLVEVARLQPALHPVRVDLAHPAIYDFGEAERAPSSVAGRVVGSRFNLADGTQDLTILIRGGYTGARLLCPAQVVQSKDSSTEITLTSTAAANMYKAGETITVYNPGQETASTPETADHEIDTINDSVITITGSTFAAWVGAGTRVTYPVLADCSTRQDDYAFYDSGTGLV